MPFPFSEPGLHYFYFARNGIYALAQLWDLAGREVLFPAYFHGVELEAFLAAGVRPRFYPVRDRMRVEVDDVLAQVTPETRAVYLIHYLGFPGPVEELSALCRQRNLPLIEDCALTLLSCLGERPLGSFGDASIFCLYKTLPVPNGGALVLRGTRFVPPPKGPAPSLASTLAQVAGSLEDHFRLQRKTWPLPLLKRMRLLGKRVSGTASSERVGVGTQHFDRSHARMAMSRLSHVVLRSQDFRGIVEKRRRNYLQLLDRLRDVTPPIFLELPPGLCPLSYSIRVRDKQAVVERLAARGVEAVNFWSQHHPALPAGSFPEVDELRRTVLELPCHQDLTPEATDRLADEVRHVMREFR